MVTLSYFIFMSLLLVLVLTVDVFLYKSSFIESLFILYKTTVSQGKWITFMMCTSGLLMCMIADYRLYKNKSTPR